MLHVGAILEFEILPLEGDRVVEQKLRGPFKNLGDSVKAKVPRKWSRDIGEYEGDVGDRNCGENGGHVGERVVQTASTACYGAIGQEKNGGDGFYVVLDLSRNTLPVELGLLRTASVEQTRRIENSNLGIGYSCIRLPKTPLLTIIPSVLVNS